MITAAVSPLNAGSVSDLKKRQDGVSSDIADTKKRLANAKYEKSEVLAEVAELDIELVAVTEDIEFISDRLDETSDLLAQTEIELMIAERDRESQFEALKERVRYMQENGVSGYLQIIFKASSVSDLLNRVDYINQIITYDKNLFGRLKETEDSIARTKEQVEKLKREQEVLKTQALNKKAVLEESKLKKNEMITLLSYEEKRYEQKIVDLEADDKRLEREIAAAEAELKRQATMKAVYTGGAIGWPVPSSQRVTSPFGNRINPINKKPEYHKGIDIGAMYGSNITAAEGGVVIGAEWSGSYGNMVVISHGNGLSTVYAHCSSMLVSKGAAVVKGQVIARIGSTGYSTGNHLHFEVRVNGVAQNPFPTYLNSR